ncbi:MAG: hypothetical protein CL917_13780 [Deltaproteobacteria bacterium]|nr:hypothetical protein [Deltaproteobacteria bacterium]
MKRDLQLPTQIMSGLAIFLLLMICSVNASALTLANLINDGETLTSKDGTVTFSQFTLSLTDFDEDLLDLYEVRTYATGFGIASPDYLPTDSGYIAISYRVKPAEGYEIDRLRMSLRRLEDEEMRGRGSMRIWEMNGDPVADLSTKINPNYFTRLSPDGNGPYDVDQLWIDPVQDLRVNQSIFAGVDPVNWQSAHKFYTTPIPEPTTAFLLGMGLIGLGVAGRRRSA